MEREEFKVLVTAWVKKLDQCEWPAITEALDGVDELVKEVRVRGIQDLLDVIAEVREELGILAPADKWVKNQVKRISQ